MHSPKEVEQFSEGLASVTKHIRNRFSTLDSSPVIPTSRSITNALSALPYGLSADGVGTKEAVNFILDKISPGLWQGHAGPRMYGFVTGGVTPAAQLADIICGSYDEQVQVSLPQATISVALEQRTCDMVLDLLDIPRSTFAGNTITTGATASNILGLTCGRDALLLKSKALPAGYNIAEHGYPPHIPSADGPVPPIQVIAVNAHGSILKAAAVTGIGRANVLDCSSALQGLDNPWGLGFDLHRLEKSLAKATSIGAGIIVVVSLGEVNTGGFTPNIRQISQMCKAHNAWLHIDAAFGGFAALLPEWQHLKHDMALADSLTLDAHKWLNAPYETALFFTHRAEDLKRSFGPSTVSGAPAYLATTAISVTHLEGSTQSEVDLRTWQASLESPLNKGIENSRRFGALPLFAALLENGKAGYIEIVQRNVDFARRIADWMQKRSGIEVLNLMPFTKETPAGDDSRLGIPLNIVLFRGTAKSAFSPEDPTASARMVAAINDTGKIYVSGTSWNGIGAVRIAVSNWRTARHGDVNGDFEAVIRVLAQIADDGQ